MFRKGENCQDQQGWKTISRIVDVVKGRCVVFVFPFLITLRVLCKFIEAKKKIIYTALGVLVAGCLHLLTESKTDRPVLVELAATYGAASHNSGRKANSGCDVSRAAWLLAS